MKVGGEVIKTTDQGWMEYIGGQGFIQKSKIYGSVLDKLNTLDIKIYIYFFILVFIIGFIGTVNYLNSLNLKHCIEAAGIMISFLNRVGCW